MSKAVAVVFAVAFLMLLAAPTIDNVLHLDPVGGTGENRGAKAWPAWPRTVTELNAFPAEFTAFHRDRFGFRKSFVAVYKWLQFVVPINRYNATVIVGSDNHLFKNSGKGYCDTWRGAKPLSEQGLARWEKVMRDRHDWMERRGGHYVYLIVPDQQTVFPEHLPSDIRRAPGPRRIEYLYHHLEAECPELALIDLREFLRDRQYPTYPISDTHWNDYGAYLGYVKIMNQLSTWYPDLKPYPLSKFKVQVEDAPGQILARMIMAADRMTDSLVTLKPKFKRSARKTKEKMPPSAAGKDPRPAWTPKAYATGNKDLPRALLLCDSMETRLVPFLAEHFSWLGVYRQDLFDADLVEWAKADVVIQERSEEYSVPYYPTNSERVRQDLAKR